MKGKGNMVSPKAGGSAPIHIPGDEVMRQSKQKGNKFRRGGKVKDKDKDQMASGGAAMPRMDKAPRKASGGAVGNRGRSPFSSAANPSPEASSGKAEANT